MFRKKLSLAAVIFSPILFIGAFGVGASAQQQAACGIGQDEIITRVRSDLAPGSNTLVATPRRLGSAATNIVRRSPECAVDVVVALCTIRPDSGSIVPMMAGAAPGQATALQQAADASCATGIAPAAGFLGPYEGPFEDDDDDDDDFIDDDDDDGSPGE